MFVSWVVGMGVLCKSRGATSASLRTRQAPGEGRTFMCANPFPLLCWFLFELLFDLLPLEMLCWNSVLVEIACQSRWSQLQYVWI